MIPFSILDLSQVVEGGSVEESFRNTARTAQAAENAGYLRYWLAEHHGMPAVASSATAVLIGHVGHATSRIRIGSANRSPTTPWRPRSPDSAPSVSTATMRVSSPTFECLPLA